MRSVGLEASELAQRADVNETHVKALLASDESLSPSMGALESIADSIELRSCRFGGGMAAARADDTDCWRGRGRGFQGTPRSTTCHRLYLLRVAAEPIAGCWRARRAIAFESPRQHRIGSGARFLKFPVWPVRNADRDKPRYRRS